VDASQTIGHALPPAAALVAPGDALAVAGVVDPAVGATLSGAAGDGLVLSWHAPNDIVNASAAASSLILCAGTRPMANLLPTASEQTRMRRPKRSRWPDSVMGTGHDHHPGRVIRSGGRATRFAARPRVEDLAHGERTNGR
jgi:hypothetical protein